MLCWCRLPIREPQAAGSAGDSNAGKTRGLQKTPVHVRQHQQQDPVFPGGLGTQISNIFGVTRKPIQSLIQIPLVKQHPQLMAPEEERKQSMPHEEDMNLQLNKLRLGWAVIASTLYCYVLWGHYPSLNVKALQQKVNLCNCSTCSPVV